MPFGVCDRLVHEELTPAIGFGGGIQANMRLILQQQAILGGAEKIYSRSGT
jgi:hypothetical protein